MLRRHHGFERFRVKRVPVGARKKRQMAPARISQSADLGTSMFGRRGNANRMNAKTLDDRAEPAGSAMAQAPSADPDAGPLSVVGLTMGGFATVIGDIIGQIDLLNTTIESACAVEVEHEFAMIAGEVRTVAGQVRQAADGIAAAVGAPGSISSEVATALAGIKDAIQRINELMANAAPAEMMSGRSSQAVPRSRFCN
jgi:methyl-accepting chemotaxis protein